MNKRLCVATGSNIKRRATHILSSPSVVKVAVPPCHCDRSKENVMMTTDRYEFYIYIHKIILYLLATMGSGEPYRLYRLISHHYNEPNKYQNTTQPATCADHQGNLYYLRLRQAKPCRPSGIKNPTIVHYADLRVF